MAKVLIVGCGDLGCAIAMRLQKTHTVIGLRKSHQLLPHGMQTIQADVTQADTLGVLDGLNPNIVIYCVAADAQTDASYRAHYVDGLKNILLSQHNSPALQHFFFVSSTRVYGQKTQTILDENVAAIPADFGGRRLLEAETLLQGLSCKTTVMRLSGIYGEGRLYLVNLSKDMKNWPQENNWSNRIHRDDAAGFIAFCVERAVNQQPIADCYIVTDDMPTQQYDVLTWLAKNQGFGTVNLQAPTIQGGKRLTNKRLRDTGFVLQYPNYQAGYSRILRQK